MSTLTTWSHCASALLVFALLTGMPRPTVAASTDQQTRSDIAARSFGSGEAEAIARRSLGGFSVPVAVSVAVPVAGSGSRLATAAPQRTVSGQPSTRLDAVRLERTERYRALIEHHSDLNHVDADLVQAIVYTESGGDARAVSPAGARGLMQLMPATARGLGVTDPLNPEQSISSGIHYLRDLLDRFGSTELALWAYNAGPGAVQRGVLPSETEAYVPRVLGVRRALLARAGGNGEQPQ